MDTNERISKQKELIETIGRNAEKDGMQPVAGRVMALLMVMDREEFSFDEIIEELNISKSSASNALNILQAMNIVEYTTRPGERKRFFRMKVRDAFFMIEELREDLMRKRNNLEKICELKANPNSKNCLFFQQLIQLTDSFLAKFELLKEEFSTKK